MREPILNFIFLFFLSGFLFAQVKPSTTTPAAKSVVTSKSRSIPAPLKGAISEEEPPPQPDDFFPLPNMKLTKIIGPPDNIDDVKVKLKDEIYSVTKAFFAAIENERDMKFAPSTINETAAAYYKSIHTIDRFSVLIRRYDASHFRAFLIRRVSRLSQNVRATNIEMAVNSLKSRNELNSEQILLLEKKLSSNKPSETFLRAPKNIFEIFSVAGLLVSMVGIYLIVVRTY